MKSISDQKLEKIISTIEEIKDLFHFSDAEDIYYEESYVNFEKYKETFLVLTSQENLEHKFIKIGEVLEDISNIIKKITPYVDGIEELINQTAQCQHPNSHLSNHLSMGAGEDTETEEIYDELFNEEIVGHPFNIELLKRGSLQPKILNIENAILYLRGKDLATTKYLKQLLDLYKNLEARQEAFELEGKLEQAMIQLDRLSG